jgi:BirA family transcriptional regulator, biotin operon repressor / biotin---[acetyl-CoA-carboxylase] ligase
VSERVPCAHAHGGGAQVLGAPRVHLRQVDSTNERARALAIAGAPHGTLVSADEQTAGRGRQGRAWFAAPGRSLLCSLVLRSPPSLLSLVAAVAACEAVGDDARVKWPNDVVVGPRLAKLAGILVEGRPQDGWAVLGIGMNVALRSEDLPGEVRDRAASLERPVSAVEPLLASLMASLSRRIVQSPAELLDAWRARDALRGREVTWAHGRGRAEGIDGDGRLLVRLEDGTTVALNAGEVHLESAVETGTQPSEQATPPSV